MDNITQTEKEFKDLSNEAKQGIIKFSKASTDKMVEYRKAYEAETGNRAGNIHLKEEFYSFVAVNNI